MTPAPASSHTLDVLVCVGGGTVIGGSEKLSPNPQSGRQYAGQLVPGLVTLSLVSMD